MTPVEIPDILQFRTSRKFKLKRFQASGSEYGGLGQTIDYADPIWEYSFKTIPIRHEDVGEVEAFFESLEGIKNPVLVYDPARKRPATAPSGTPWGSPVVSATSRALSVVQLSGLTEGFEIKKGDFFSFVESGRYHLYKSRTSVTATNTGVVDLEVSPRPARNLVASNQTVRFDKPVCCAVMKVEDPEIDENKHYIFTVSGHQMTSSFL